MRPHVALLALVAVAAAATGTAATIGAASDGGDPEQMLVLPRMEQAQHAKNSWPELVGKPASDAKAAVESEDPSLKVYLVPQGSVMTMDYRSDRVRIVYNTESNEVVSMPRIG